MMMKKSIEKFFKKKEEGDVLDAHALSGVPQSDLIQIVIKLDTELKEKLREVESLDESKKQAKRDCSRIEEELKLYKTHCEELQNLAKKLSGEAEDFKTLLESRAQEIKYFRERNNELEKQSKAFEEASKTLQVLEETQNKLRLSEEKNSKLQEDVEILNKCKKKLEEDYNLVLELLETSNKKKGEAELSLKKVQEEYDKSKKKSKTLRQSDRENVQKIKDLEAQVKGKQQRIQELEEGLKNSSASISDKVSVYDALQKEFNTLKENFEKEIKEKNAKIMQLETKILSEIQLEVSQSTAHLQKELDDYKLKVSELESEKSQLLNAQSQLNATLKENQITINQLNETLEEAQKKRQLARAEVLRLNQKLEQASVESKQPNLSGRSNPAAPIDWKGLSQMSEENRVLNLLKYQMDILYKSLMTLMMESQSVRDTVTNVIKYQIAAESFSTFEKDLNKIVMDVHEAAENPSLILDNGKTWMGKITNMMHWTQPSKFLSCVVNTEQNERNMGNSKAPSKKSFNRLDMSFSG